MSYVVEVDGKEVYSTSDEAEVFAFVIGFLRGLSRKAWIKVDAESGDGDVCAIFRVRCKLDGKERQAEIVVRKAKVKVLCKSCLHMLPWYYFRSREGG